MSIGDKTAAYAKPAATSAMPEWARLLKMYWPRTDWVNESDIGLAMREITRATDRNPATQDELIEVVEWMAGPESNQKFAPSLREFVISIYVYRKQQNGGGYDTRAANSSIVDEVKLAMRRTQSWRERWNIMCQPTLYAGLSRDPDYDETLCLDRWATDTWPQWYDKTMEIKAGYAEGIRQARLSMFGAIRNESRPDKSELAYNENIPF